MSWPIFFAGAAMFFVGMALTYCAATYLELRGAREAERHQLNVPDGKLTAQHPTGQHPATHQTFRAGRATRIHRKGSREGASTAHSDRAAPWPRNCCAACGELGPGTREGFALTTVSTYNEEVIPTATGTGATAPGFTEFDLATLGRLRTVQLAEKRWSRAHVVHGPYADFLAAWEAGAAGADLPHLTIARFKRTGTYALTVGAMVVATARTLDPVLPLADGAPRLARLA